MIVRANTRGMGGHTVGAPGIAQIPSTVTVSSHASIHPLARHITTAHHREASMNGTIRTKKRLLLVSMITVGMMGFAPAASAGTMWDAIAFGGNGKDGGFVFSFEGGPAMARGGDGGDAVALGRHGAFAYGGDGGDSGAVVSVNGGGADASGGNGGDAAAIVS